MLWSRCYKNLCFNPKRSCSIPQNTQQHNGRLCKQQAPHKRRKPGLKQSTPNYTGLFSNLDHNNRQCWRVLGTESGNESLRRSLQSLSEQGTRMNAFTPVYIPTRKSTAHTRAHCNYSSSTLICLDLLYCRMLYLCMHRTLEYETPSTQKNKKQLRGPDLRPTSF